MMEPVGLSLRSGDAGDHGPDSRRDRMMEPVGLSPGELEMMEPVACIRRMEVGDGGRPQPSAA